MNKSSHVVIAGAGVVGLTLAALLLKSRHSHNVKLTVLDAAAMPTFSADQDLGLRVSAISSGSAKILAEAGAWPAIQGERVCKYSEMRVWDAGGAIEGPETLRFSASDYGVQQLGFIVENQLVQHALIVELQGQGLSVNFNSAIHAVDRTSNGYRLKLADGGFMDADLLIGADGSGSFVRKQAGINVSGWQYAQAAFVTHLHAEKNHRNTAWQRFLQSGPVALLPLADGRVSIVWSTSPDEAAAASVMDDEALSSKLTSITDRVLGQLTPASPRGSFPLQAQHARQYVLPGLALIGDAAHSVHPLAGQGANLGIADACCLADVIVSAAASNEGISDFRVLRRYERARKGANKRMLHFVDGINRLFASKSSSIAALRATGMRLFNRSGPIRDYAVRVALGLNGQ